MFNKRPLAGIRVCDFSWVGAGPYTTRMLSEFGAEVIRLESRTRPEILRLGGPYEDGLAGTERRGYCSNRNPNKKSIDIDMKNPKARDVVVKLIQASDIVINNFTFGTMEKLNLDYEEVKKIKQDIIYVTMPTMGSIEPHKHYLGFGATMNALVGINYPDLVPNPVHTAFAIIVALYHKQKTGEGQLIDVAQTEAALSVLPTAVMNYVANGTIQERLGMREINGNVAAPHGVYATKDTQRWIAIAVYNQAEWEAFKKIIGNPEWIEGESFASLNNRLVNQEQLDKLIEAWAKEQEPYGLMDGLIKAGVRAEVVQNAKDMLQEIYPKELDYWVYLNHKEMCRHGYNNKHARLSKIPAQVLTPAPLFGEHTEQVMKEVLGLSPDEIAQLKAAKVIS
jgi:crotonobetainyl-CoA:carnitine CoA-transferase CaiB-like acyl-CoA transferase